MIDDAELLRRYAGEKSDDAFAELVRRHIDFVYAAALRQARGNAPLAQDVTQVVFIDLARKAASLARHEVVVGWLHTATRFAAAKAIRAESRRHAREREAQAMNEMRPDADAPVDWERLHPVLDDVLGELKERERAAILLRFFEKKPLAEVGAKLSLTETAARSCVDRALEKMRERLARRGVTSTSAALAVALTNQVGVAAPAGLAASVTGAALAGGGAAATGVGAWTIFMGMTKLQIVMAGVVAATGMTGIVVQARAITGLRDELAGLRQQNQAAVSLNVENSRLARIAAEAETARTQSAELAKLNGESAALRSRLQLISAARAAKPQAARKTEAPFTGTYFEPSQVDTEPKAIFQPRPDYPAEFWKLGVTGNVTVDFVVDAKGLVHNATVVKATHPAIGESAVEAVSQWEFEPAQKNGQAVAMHHQMPIAFTITKRESATTKPSDHPKPRPTTFVPWF